MTPSGINASGGVDSVKGSVMGGLLPARGSSIGDTGGAPVGFVVTDWMFELVNSSVCIGLGSGAVYVSAGGFSGGDVGVDFDHQKLRVFRGILKASVWRVIERCIVVSTRRLLNACVGSHLDSGGKGT